MQSHEGFSSGETSDTNASNMEYAYPSFEQHMQELAARENGEVVPDEARSSQGEQLSETGEHDSASESVLANNPYSPYFNYETGLKENNEKFGESFAKLNESVYEEYSKASEDALTSSTEYWKYSSILDTYGVDVSTGTRHYRIHEGDGNAREVVTPLKIDVGLDGKVANREDFEPEALEIFESLQAKETEAYVKSTMDEQKEMQALIQLNILNGGFANHGIENATIDTRNDMPDYQESIKDKLAIDGDTAVIPPNPNGEMSLAEYIGSVAENYNDMANDLRESFEEFQSKFDKVSDTYFHSKNPIKSLFAGRKYRKMRAQYNDRLQELKTINLYRSAANDLQYKLGRQN